MSDLGKSGTRSDGDWICEDPECSNLNFARRSSCNRCGKDKAEASQTSKKTTGIEIGKAAADKSRGLFSADDWQCSKCGNVNWARRQQCNMCNAPKFGDVEERTGYGGGYNDRGIVEYVARDDSDDEYDEFGRKRKRFRRMSKSDEEDGGEMSNNIQLKDHETIKTKKSEKSDEEDEDDEDGDLSKYDLSDWTNDVKQEDESLTKPSSSDQRLDTNRDS